MFLQINPIAFSLGPLTVHWYGIFIALAFLAGLIVASHEAKRNNLNPEIIIDMILWMFPFIIIGLRLYFVIFNWDYYSQNPSQIFAIWGGGLAIHGALFACILVAIVFVKKKNISFWLLADCTAPGIILGQAIGRWGNFINQEAYGGIVSRGFLENLFIPEWIIEQMYINGNYHHPTFLYESIWNLLIFIFLFFFWKKQDFLKRGDVFLTYFALYSVGRFFIEGLRTDSLMLGDIRVAQLVSVILIIVSINISIYKHLETE